ncbi:glycosyltransferase family 4 protein [Marinovum sp. 2_MG-2023]|uniref:glycosyltransferase family 4 protein n=1 Tax=unclassified Marinovum TaxID=2647166 RepID=UPI0026E14203|nr:MULTISPECIES: glycosyltransferase family 4 protein [unclassified Marinovum]MDO6731546.1 glycosyltransferase family 4 protein [Marinovum sp. 2_MG-2023]MDO6780906.1 glycosyltransferase family 4 protein [Marinovum sp. 1_MG-2023]
MTGVTKYLLIHQNFPGQYKHLAPALAARGDQVVALTPKVDKPTQWNGVTIVPYKINGNPAKGQHPWLQDFETKVIRGQSCYTAALALKARGFSPDVILAHHGWGESLFLKDVWPEARLGLYCELYHTAEYPFVGFDPEFTGTSPATDALRLRFKNLNNRLHFEVGDAGISPTAFQADTFPPDMRARISVIHDGIDTDYVTADSNAQLDVGNGQTLTRDVEVITFINRNLEPYRGYHIFMRALPDLLRRRPKAQIVLIGGDQVSYGAKAPDGKSWKQVFIDEVRDQIPDADWARVHFLGRVPYGVFLSFMRVSRAHVYLTYPFVLSWSLLEAMSAGAPIVASDTAPVREVLTDGDTGLLVDFFDRTALVDKVCTLLDDADLRDHLRRNARAHVVAHYDLKRISLPKQLAWVDSLMQLKPRAPQV